MPTVKRAICLIILLSICVQSFSQSTIPAPGTTHYQHYTFWSAISVLKTVKRWGISADYQRRRQNFHTNINLFESHLLHNFQTRVRYDVNDQLAISILPFTYFYSSPLINNEKNYQRRFDKEFRFAIQAEMRQQLGAVDIYNRYVYENRWIKRSTDTIYQPVGRFRYRFLLERPFIDKKTNKVKYRPYAFGEIFLNAGKQIGMTQILDQLRGATGVRWHLSPFLRLDTGYQYNRKFRKSGFEIDNEHSLVMSLNILL